MSSTSVKEYLNTVQYKNSVFVILNLKILQQKDGEGEAAGQALSYRSTKRGLHTKRSAIKEKCEIRDGTFPTLFTINVYQI